MQFISRYLRRFPYAFSGLWYALRHDFSFRWQVVLIPLLIAVVTYLATPLETLEVLFLGLAYTLILLTELQNSALEEALDHLHPEMHMRIGRTKDMAAGSVLLAAGFFVFVVGVIFIT
jgi:diacylglycerol kinase